MSMSPAPAPLRPVAPIVRPKPALVRTEPDIINVPAPVISIPTISPIAIRPRQPDGPSATTATRLALQSRLEGIREKYAIPGISVTILFPDGTTWVGSSGMADLAEKRPVTPDTAFAIASVSKTFLAALIMALSEDGKLVLDAQVRTYLPGLRLDPKITVRQLLDHTSGLRDYFFHPMIDKILLSHPDRRWDSLQSMRYVGKRYFKPGRGWHYSNTNYLILGMLAERVTGKTLATLFHDRFFEPLGMRHTYYQPADTATGPVAHGYRFETAAIDSKPIDLSDGSGIVPFTSVVTAAAGAGAIASTSSDLARWARALYAGDVLRERSVQEMVDDVARTERYRPTVPYGLGVQLVDVAGHQTLGHSGRLLGFRSVVRWLPEEHVSIAVLTNQSRTDPAIIARALLKISLRSSEDGGVRRPPHAVGR
ncbi:MAG TPA: serine hydrolase domain-containing protein [Candidatus Saccharimonadales bacterium]|nr:serine hydrolase domain-containing protein [Candidatus Saccharimonadales bacterium]